MKSPFLPRRDFLTATALAALGESASAFSNAADGSVQPSASRGAQPMSDQYPVKAIASRNGLNATQRAYQLLQEGRDTLEAVVEGVSLVEADPEDMSVGYGGLPNEQGIVELDAAVMHGPTHRAGAVAALKNIKHPAQVARLVMSRSDHVLLVGEGALRFAKAHGFPEESLLTEKARKIWLYWKQTLSERDDWLSPSADDVDPEVAKFFKLPVKDPPKEKEKSSPSQKEKSSTDSGKRGKKFKRPTGTIHCTALNALGDISCTTSTSGLAFKIPGRVGDSPIIGAGLYADNEIGSCGSTGRGEANLQDLCCFAAVELMRGGASPEEAGMEVLRRVARHTTEKRLLDERGRPNFGLKFYLLAKDGRHAGVSLWGPTEFAVTDKKGTRLEKCAFLHKKTNK